MKAALFCLLTAVALAAEPEFPLTADSQPQPGVAKGTLLKGSYTARQGSVFPGTVRDYQIYLPAGFDQTQPPPFMVFQDGVIYQAPAVFDNLIAQKAIPPLVGVFIKPGVVPAVSDNALPRFNRSYEYDSVTDTYSRFLIDEFLPALEAEHGLRFSTDPNQAAIAGNSSGGICAFMTAWHRPDRFRRVFTGVGTYVGIRGADRLPVLVRKIEPKPLRVFLQSGTGDNNLYCGDWWMANQMMERSLAWAGYEVKHAWGEGGHNQKHASQVFPEALRWLWRDWQTDLEVKANPKGESKWRGYEVVGAGEWERVGLGEGRHSVLFHITSNLHGDVFATSNSMPTSAPDGAHRVSRRIILKVAPSGEWTVISDDRTFALGLAFDSEGALRVSEQGRPSEKQVIVGLDDHGRQVGKELTWPALPNGMEVEPERLCFANSGFCIFTTRSGNIMRGVFPDGKTLDFPVSATEFGGQPNAITLSPDQTMLYFTTGPLSEYVGCFSLLPSGALVNAQRFCQLDRDGNERHSRLNATGLCVDSNGWLYVATSLGIQVCDQAGRVNFILPTPKPASDVCFGGKDLSELFIACGDTIYKRPTKARGVVSGQQPPIKPAPPKL
jgi:gluconolactonase